MTAVSLSCAGAGEVSLRGITDTTVPKCTECPPCEMFLVFHSIMNLRGVGLGEYIVVNYIWNLGHDVDHEIRRLKDKIKIFLKGYFTASFPCLIKIFSRLSGDPVQLPLEMLCLPFNIWFLFDSSGAGKLTFDAVVFYRQTIGFSLHWVKGLSQDLWTCALLSITFDMSIQQLGSPAPTVSWQSPRP